MNKNNTKIKCEICKIESTNTVRCPHCGVRFMLGKNRDGYKRDITIRKIFNWRKSKVTMQNMDYCIQENYVHINLQVPEIIDRTTLFASLHEMGHIANNHQSYNRKPSASRKITMETEAWLYALKCIKPLYKVELIEMAMGCIKTYFPMRYYHTYNFGLIKAMLQQEITITKKIKLMKRNDPWLLKNHE